MLILDVYNIDELDTDKIRLKVGDQHIITKNTRLKTEYISADNFRVKKVSNGKSSTYCYMDKVTLPIDGRAKIRVGTERGQYLDSIEVRIPGKTNLNVELEERLDSPKAAAVVMDVPLYPRILFTRVVDIPLSVKNVEAESIKV